MHRTARRAAAQGAAPAQPQPQPPPTWADDPGVAHRVLVLDLPAQHDGAGLKAAVGVVWEAGGGLVCGQLELIQHQEGVQVLQGRGAQGAADAHACSRRGGSGQAGREEVEERGHRRGGDGRGGMHNTQQRQQQEAARGGTSDRTGPPAPSMPFCPLTTALMGRTAAAAAAAAAPLVMSRRLLAASAWWGEARERSRRSTGSQAAGGSWRGWLKVVLRMVPHGWAPAGSVDGGWWGSGAGSAAGEAPPLPLLNRLAQPSVRRCSLQPAAGAMHAVIRCCGQSPHPPAVPQTPLHCTHLCWGVWGRWKRAECTLNTGCGVQERHR